MNLITLRGISCHTPPGKVILEGIDWDIDEGSHWALFGPNGCGKTVLLEIVMGYRPPSGGTVVRDLGGADTIDIREIRRSIGYVSTPLREMFNPGESVLDVVGSGYFASVGLYEPVPGSGQGRALTLLESLGMAGRRSERFGVLSDGEKQKVLLARAMMNDPALLVLDEPAANLDYSAREDLIESLGAVRSGGRTSVVYVTHRIEEIPPVCDMVLMLKAGKTYYRGGIDEGLTSARLSGLYDRDLSIRREGGRFFAVPRG